MTDMETAIGKLVSDKKFRKDLFANPESTLRSHGLTLSKEEVEKIKRTDPKKIEEALAAAKSVFIPEGVVLIIAPTP